MPLDVRPALSTEAALIASFQCAMARESEGRGLDPAVVEAGVRAVFARPEAGFYLVALRGDDVLGSLLVTPEWSDWRNGWFWWIQSVYVRPEARRQGVYRALHARVRRLAARRDDVVGLRLYVERENDGARRAHERLGLEETPYRLYEQRTAWPPADPPAAGDRVAGAPTS